MSDVTLRIARMAYDDACAILNAAEAAHSAAEAASQRYKSRNAYDSARRSALEAAGSLLAYARYLHGLTAMGVTEAIAECGNAQQ